MRVHPQPKRAKIEVAIRKGVGEGERLGIGTRRNDKEQSPTVEHKEIY